MMLSPFYQGVLFVFVLFLAQLEEKQLPQSFLPFPLSLSLVFGGKVSFIWTCHGKQSNFMCT